MFGKVNVKRLLSLCPIVYAAYVNCMVITWTRAWIIMTVSGVSTEYYAMGLTMRGLIPFFFVYISKNRPSPSFLCPSLFFAVGPVSAPREGAMLARSPLYPLLPGALVRLMVTKGASAFAEALLADG